MVIYGSRARGDYKHGSDIDLNIQGTLSNSELVKLENELDDLLLPYKIDLSMLSEIRNPNLLAQIRKGRVFFDSAHNLAVNEPAPEFKEGGMD